MVRLFILFLLLSFILTTDQFLKISIKTTLPLNQTLKSCLPFLNLIHKENPGASLGMKYAGNFGKVNLTFVRIFISSLLGFSIWYLNKVHCNFQITFSLALILSGLLGNIIDNVFYEAIFSLNPHSQLYHLNDSIKVEKLFFGNVVDMAHVSFFPFVIFNLSDLIVSIGAILFWKNRFIFFKEILKISESFRHED